ncbi:MAG: hypothetical protein QNJ45_04175 [Ardenticatenaceae bacterium]|nr:hypothetical protein [Ardenticatenaceae bacterium]
MEINHSPKSILNRQRLLFFSVFFLLLLSLAGCLEEEESAPPPTVAVIFSTITPLPTITPRPTTPPPPTLTPTPTPQLETVVIYDDELAPGWSIDNSQFTFVEPQTTEFIYDGEAALKVSPRIEASSSFYVTLDAAAENLYRKEDIVKLSFYLNPGPEVILPDDLAVTLQGSNEFPFWVEGDNSVQIAGNINPFSETLLVFLDINRTIPEDTWVLIELYPDEREFDPEYEFFTGFYIKNSLGFLQPYYIDRIELTTIVRPEDS